MIRQMEEKQRGLLNQCHMNLQVLFSEVYRHLDFFILCANRSDEDQEKAFLAGKSKLRAGQSKHNLHPSLAIDIQPVCGAKERDYYYFAGFVKAIAATIGIPIRWGGDWNDNADFSDNSFNDLYHFELRDK